MLYQTPFIPKIGGKISKQGSKNNNWRVNDKKIAFFAMPIL